MYKLYINMIKGVYLHFHEHYWDDMLIKGKMKWYSIKQFAFHEKKMWARVVPPGVEKVVACCVQ